MNLNEWIDGIISKKRARGYTEDELAEYRRDLEFRYAGLTDEEFATAQAAAAKARKARDRKMNRRTR